MYIQITTRCNMLCRHCCMKATRKGMDMSMDVFRAAMELSQNLGDESISIGGGEPTIHPLFWEIMGISIGHWDYVWLATNGSQTETALTLAKLAKKGTIGCALSQDPWHDPIDQRVVAAFTRKNEDKFHYANDFREIRDVSKNGNDSMALWRVEKEGGTKKFCGCPDLFIKPTGDVHVCGCRKSPKLGNVLNGFDFISVEPGECYLRQPKEILQEIAAKVA